MNLPPALHRTILVVDVEGFTDPTRNLADLAAVREGMYDVLKIAFADSGVDFDSCEREDRGDGALMLVPPTVSKSVIADRLPDRLVVALRRYNSTRSAHAQFKLRVALHSGDIRRDGDGWVGHAVNLAFRILDAQDAKTALAESDRLVALISSEHFYSEVIEQDPGTVPESYRQIDVKVKNFQGNAWLRMLGSGGARRSPVDVDRHERVLELIPFEALDTLRDPLILSEVPRLPFLMSCAAGPAIPVPQRGDVQNAWDAVIYLAEFNAGPDGIPPAVLFLRLLAGELGGEVGELITSWVSDQARRLRLTPALEQRPKHQVPDDQHLRLVIMLEPDLVDQNQCTVTFWRQDDPRVWPPTRGDERKASIDELEFRVDEIILEAEEKWAGNGFSAALEFLLPRGLLHLPVMSWCKEHGSKRPRLLRYDYGIVLRSLERARGKRWHRVWNGRWDSMLEEPTADRLHYSGSAEFKEYPIEAVLSDPAWVGLALTGTPPPQPGESDELIAALRAGLPVLMWHPDAGPEDLRPLLDWLLNGDSGFLDLLARRKMAQVPAQVPVEDYLVSGLVILWDDPKRLIG